MKYVLHATMIAVCMLIAIPSSTAIENPVVDVEISRAEIDYLYLNITISNPGIKDVYLTGLDISISDPIGESGSEKWETPLLIKPNESTVHSSRHFITAGDPLKRFYRKGSANITISGSLFVETDSNSFVVPFYKTTNVFHETDEAKQVTSPYITDINIDVNRLTDEKGIIKMVITTTNISIYNPNPIAFNLREFYCEIAAMEKKDDKTRRLKSLPGCGFSSSDTRLIMPNKIYVYNLEQTISDNDTIQYFISDEPKYIRVKGSAFLIPKETGWSPAYFEPTFNAIIIINGTSVSEKDTSTPAQTSTLAPTSMPISEKEAAGFEVVLSITILLTAYITKRKKR